jgi:Domain of unknown function (DUF4296)
MMNFKALINNFNLIVGPEYSGQIFRRLYLTFGRFQTFRRLSYVIVFLGAFFACQNSAKAPISEATLMKVLLDVHTAEALVEGENQNVRDSMAKIYYAQIFQKHNVSRIDFDSTMAIYSRHPTQLDTIYNRLLKTVKAERDSLGKPH